MTASNEKAAPSRAALPKEDHCQQIIARFLNLIVDCLIDAGDHENAVSKIVTREVPLTIPELDEIDINLRAARLQINRALGYGKRIRIRLERLP
jgi:hypothetical protein